jgi:hypothetical protein
MGRTSTAGLQARQFSAPEHRCASISIVHVPTGIDCENGTYIGSRLSARGSVDREGDGGEESNQCRKSKHVDWVLSAQTEPKSVYLYCFA